MSIKNMSERRKATRRRLQDKKRAEEKAASATKAAAGLRYYVERFDRETLEERLAEIPADTRNLTARICGDPLPGRSALDRRQA